MRASPPRSTVKNNMNAECFAVGKTGWDRVARNSSGFGDVHCNKG